MTKGPVELGTFADNPDAEALAIRLASEQGGTGIPTMDHQGDALAQRRAGWFVRFIETMRTYGELRRTPYGLVPVGIISTIAFFQRLDSTTFAVAGPDIVRDLEVKITTLIETQRIIGVFLIFAVIYMGYVADRHRRVPFLAVGTILSGLFGMISSRAQGIVSLGVPRVADDVGDEASGIVRFSLLADYYPPEARGKVFALINTMRRIGSLLAIFAAGLLITYHGWRTATLVMAAPLVVVGFVALVRLREPIRGYMERRTLGASDDVARKEDEPLSFGEGWRTTFSVRTLRRLFISDCFALAGDTVFALFLPFYLAEKYGLNAFERSMVGLLPLIMALIGGFYGGGLMDRFIRRNPGRVLRVLAVFQLIASVGVVGVALKPPLALLIVFNAVNAFGAALIGPAAAAVYTQVIPASVRTQGLQVTGLAALPGLIFVTPVAERIFDLYGYERVFLFAAPFLIVGGVIAVTAASFFDLDARSAFAAAMATEEWRRTRAEGKGKLLVCRDVSVEYDGVQVLFGVDFDVEDGQLIALLGTNGAGKSTLLRAIGGIREASGGAIVFDGRDITHMPPHEIAARGVITMPGGRGIFPGLTVRENLLLARWLTEGTVAAQEQLAEVFVVFPILRERVDQPASALSGGEQQQLSLAQAFLAQPRLLMIDELSLGLSPAVVAQLLETVRELHRRGVTIIVVEQSVNVALTLAEKAIFMEKGEIRFFGDTADLLARPDILRAVYVKGTGALTTGASAPVRRRRDLDEGRAILAVEGLVKRFGGVTAVDGVSFDLRDGEVLGLIGPNGAGKTTVFDLIGGYLTPDAGSVVFEGVDIAALSPDERARRGLVRRFQDARLFPALTVAETLLTALDRRLEVKSSVLNALALPQARRAERRLRLRMEHLLELLELGAYRDKFVKELSTGLRRIVDLACVLATEPHVLLLDEPSSGVAQAEAEGLAPLLRRVRYETGCSILIIEHDMPLISAVSDELLALDTGKVLLRGEPEQVLNDDRVIESYLGTSEAVLRRRGRA